MLAIPCVILFAFAFVGDLALRTPVGLHSFGKVDIASWDKGIVSAEGTWEPERKPERILSLTLSHPLNISNITCIRQLGVCEVATAMLDLSPPGSGYYLSQDTDRLEIKSWNSATIEFVTGNPPFDCFVERYVIARSTQTITGLSTAEGKCDPPAGMKGIADRRPLKLAFVSGSDLALKRQLEDEGPTRALVFYLFAGVSVAWLLFCIIWIVRVVRR
jgi:hypothetical protein